jgi:integrase
MSRSTFSILPYINRQKVKADGTANILCRITVDGKSAAISTGISCTPQEWNAKKGEVRNARDNGRLASFLAEVKDKYNSLLTANGIITVEMLKAVLKDKDTTGRFLLNFGDTIVEWYRTSKARQTFLHKRTWQKNLRAFVHSLDKDDIAFEDIDENFGEEYKLFLKRDQGRIDSYVNHCLLWLNMLMYKAVDRSIIRFNPIAKIGYEKKAAPKMTHISKADFIKMLSTPMADERTELARRCFIFASLTSLSYIDVKKLYPHHISENSEGRKFIRKEREKTGVEFFVPLHPIAEKILSLYNTTDDSKPVFPLGEKKDIYLDVHTLGMVLGISNKLGFHASRHTFGVLMLNEDIPIGSIAKMMGHADITSTQVSECMAAGVESQLITYAKHHSKGMHIKIDVFLLTQWKNRLAVVRGIVERKNLLGYRMEWHEELHACLLSFLADELPTLGVLTDMVRVQFLYIYIG